MLTLFSVSKAQKQLCEHLRARRLQQGYTQEDLARRAGMSLPTLRRFEQKGLVTMDNFLKLLAILGGLEQLVDSLKPSSQIYGSIDDVLKDRPGKLRKRGRRK